MTFSRFRFLCLCLSLCVHAEMKNSRQFTTLDTVLCASSSFEDSRLCAESHCAKLISALQLILRSSPAAFHHSFESQRLQSIVLQYLQPEHTFSIHRRRQNIHTKPLRLFHSRYQNFSRWSSRYRRRNRYQSRTIWYFDHKAQAQSRSWSHPM